MARVYVADGLDAGNLVMKQFDPEADAISELTAELDALAVRAADDGAVAGSHGPCV